MLLSYHRNGVLRRNVACDEEVATSPEREASRPVQTPALGKHLHESPLMRSYSNTWLLLLVTKRSPPVLNTSSTRVHEAAALSEYALKRTSRAVYRSYLIRTRLAT